MLRFLLLILLGSAPIIQAANWPSWRGPTGDGIVPADTPLTPWPTSWSPEKNIVWKTALPSGGNSTPIVWGNRVLLTSASEKGAKRALLCFDRADGKLLWQNVLAFEEKEPTHDTNPYCSASPITDGERIICSFGSAGVASFDFDGKILWHRKDLGPLNHIWGNASSPIFSGDHVIQYWGPGLTCCLIALNKKTGETIWKHDLPEACAKTPDQFYGSWSTPVIREFIAENGQSKRELILGLPKKVVALDLETRQTNWFCEGLGPLVYTNPIVGKNAVAVLSGYQGPALAVKFGGHGDVTSTHRLWHIADKKLLPQRVGSAVLYGDHYYILNDSGTVQCTELTTGKDAWNEPLTKSAWSSASIADGKLYVIDQRGETLVLDAAPKFRLISRNPLNEPNRASHAFSDGQIFIRTYRHLFCVAEKK